MVSHHMKRGTALVLTGKYKFKLQWNIAQSKIKFGKDMEQLRLSTLPWVWKA